MGINSKLLASSLLLVINQLALRGLGLISTLVLARLLTPEDFGIVALVTITLLFFDLTSDAGSQQYLIQKTQISNQDLNTAWSIDIVMKTALAATLFLTAPYIAQFFEQSELTFAIQIISVVLPIKALKNPRLAQLSREFTYKKLVYLQVTQKILSLIIVLGIIITVEASYWAIILGDIVAALIFTLGSYYIVSYTPKLSLSNFTEQWHFSKWLLLRSIIGFSRGQLDIAFISKLFGTTQLGGYHMSRELALIPAHNLLIPAIEPIMAAIAQTKHDLNALSYRIRFSLYCILLAVIPLTGFIWNFSYEIILVILGEQWSQYHLLLKYFSLMFMTFPIFALFSDNLIAIGKVKTLFYFDFLTAALLALTLYLSRDSSIELFTQIRCFFSLVITLLFIVLINYYTRFQIARSVTLALPIVAITLIAGYATSLLSSHIESSALLRLIFATVCFFSIFLLLFYCTSKLLLSKYEEIQHLSRIMQMVTTRRGRVDNCAQ